MSTQNNNYLDYMEGGNELISMKNVSLTYKGDKTSTTVLDNINLNIYGGEFVCVMGPSGCGKSTLLKILAGFLKATSGSVQLRQKEIKGSDPERGVVFQQAPLYEWYNVRENIAFGPKVQGRKNDEIKDDVEKYLKQVGLEGSGDKKVYELSGGMKQRVSIASALINNPKILLMDEPFGALDALTREQMQNLVRRIWWDTGKTVFFITHDVDEALVLGTRVLVMSKNPGRIVAEKEVNFTKEFIRENSDDLRYSEQYHQIRKEILSLIE